MKRIKNLTFLVLLFSVFISFFFKDHSISASENASITIDASNKLHAVPPEIFGSNIQWEHNGDGSRLVQNEKHIWQENFIEAVKIAGVSVIRFPGGALSNNYRWKDAVGPVASRLKGLSFSKDKVDSMFGTDEYLELLKKTTSEGLLTLNSSMGEQYSVDWLKYIYNSIESKKKTGNRRTKDSYLRYLELGNEIYSPKETGYIKAKDYAKKYLKYKRLIKQSFPDIKIGIALEASFISADWMRSVYPHLLTWNEDVLSILKDDVDFVVLHFYVPYKKLFDDTELNKLVLAGSELFSHNLSKINNLLLKYSPSAKIIVSEYGTFFDSKITPSKRISSTENALFTALMMHAFMKEKKIIMANHWSLINNSSFGMIQTSTEKLSKMPTYFVFKLLKKMKSGNILDVMVLSPSYDVAEEGNFTSLKAVRFLDAVSVSTGNSSILLSVVNRSSTKTFSTSLSAEYGRMDCHSQYSLLAKKSVSYEFDISEKAVSGNKVMIKPHSLNLFECDYSHGEQA